MKTPQFKVGDIIVHSVIKNNPCEVISINEYHYELVNITEVCDSSFFPIDMIDRTCRKLTKLELSMK